MRAADLVQSPGRRLKVMHLTTVDMSLYLLLRPQMRAARDRGYEVVGTSASGPYVDELEHEGFRHIALEGSTRSHSLLSDFRAARSLWRVIRAERPDILHTHNPKPGVYGRVVGRLAGVPAIVNTVHGLYATPEDRRLRRGIVYGLESFASRFGDVELVQNPEDFGLMTGGRLWPRPKLRFLGNGVDLDRFRPDVLNIERRRSRAHIGVADGDVVVGAVGRLVAEKGFLELFDAFRQLPPGVRLVVVGPIETEKADAISTPVVEEMRARGVIFLGERRDIEAVYQLFDIFVLASHREGFPRAAMEAAASALPLIVTDIRGCRQVVDHGVNGLRVPVRDPGALAAAIKQLAEDQPLRVEMGAAGRAKAVAEFDERMIAARVLRTYADVAYRRRGARVKRALDVTVAAVGLVVLSPLLAVLAAVVAIGVGRPVLFRQERPGRHGEPFIILKFRTMNDHRDEAGNVLPDGQRLTKVGRLLRSLSLDELPELVNVLRGEMSLVGPRPLLTEYLDLYDARQARRHDVRPGVTGLAQVAGRNALAWPERLELDARYVDNWSLGLDAQILWWTARAVMSRQGVTRPGHATVPYFSHEVSGRDS